MVGEISHFAPLVNKHEQHSAVLNNEHKHEQHSAVLNNEHKHEQHPAVLNNEHKHEQHPAVLKVDPKKDIDPYYVPVNPNISVVSKYDQHDVDFDKLAKSFNAMEEVYEAHKFKNINDYGLNASNIIEDALKTTKNPSIICELQKMRDDLHDINQALLNAIPNDQQTVYVIPPTATEHAHISFTLNSQEVISTNENIKNLNSLKNIFREYIEMYNSHTYPDVMQHGEKARDLIEAALRIGHNPYINLIQSIIYNDVCDVLSNEARLSSR